MRKQCVFGPILSRRLGWSLGINLVPYKTCNLDCIYCECGATTNPVQERKEYLSTDVVIETLKEAALRLRGNPPSCVTFAGWGEPTLHLYFGEIARAVKKIFPEEHIVLITNGTLFAQDERLLSEVQGIDIVIPSLDAGHEETFAYINRPFPSLTLQEHLRGLSLLRKNFPREIWLEVFIVEGVNDNQRELQALKEHIVRLSPDKVHINTVDRRPACEWVRAPSPEKLQEIARFLGGEVIPPLHRERVTP